MLRTQMRTRFSRAYLFGQFAGLVRIVLDLIVEDREIQGQAEADGVCGVHVFLAYFRCLLISLL